MKLERLAAIAILALSVVNCSMDISVEDLAGPDFLMSKVLSVTDGVSDGSTPAVVTIELRNSDNTLIANHVPTLSLLSGITVNLGVCTASTALGISTCLINAADPGLATIAINNIKIELQFNAVFTAPPKSGTFLQILSAAQNNEDASGYKVTSQVGAPFQGLYHEGSNGTGTYQIFTGTTGAITPVE